MDGMQDNQEAIENHLLFYKSLMRNNTDMEKVNHYLEILHEHDESRIKLDNPVDEGIRTAFRLVRDANMDPWDIDIHEFVKLYSSRLKHSKFNIIVAGKLLVLAWDVVRLQSEVTRQNSEMVYAVEEEYEPDFSGEEEVLAIPDFMGEQSVGREPTRPATFIEILGVIDEIGKDMERAEERERIAIELMKQRKEEKKFKHKMDAELEEKDIDRIWNRIQKIGVGEFSIKELYTVSAKENITVFLSILHLVFRGYLDVVQDDLLHGDIRLSMVVNHSVAKMEDQTQEIEVV